MKHLAGFFRGFFLTLVIIGCILGGVYGLSLAETNTRRVGFGDNSGSTILYFDRETGELRVFGKEV